MEVTHANLVSFFQSQLSIYQQQLRQLGSFKYKFFPPNLSDTIIPIQEKNMLKNDGQYRKEFIDSYNKLFPNGIENISETSIISIFDIIKKTKSVGEKVFLMEKINNFRDQLKFCLINNAIFNIFCGWITLDTIIEKKELIIKIIEFGSSIKLTRDDIMSHCVGFIRKLQELKRSKDNDIGSVAGPLFKEWRSICMTNDKIEIRPLLLSSYSDLNINAKPTHTVVDITNEAMTRPSPNPLPDPKRRRITWKTGRDFVIRHTYFSEVDNTPYIVQESQLRDIDGMSSMINMKAHNHMMELMSDNSHDINGKEEQIWVKPFSFITILPSELCSYQYEDDMISSKLETTYYTTIPDDPSELNNCQIIVCPTIKIKRIPKYKPIQNLPQSQSPQQSQPQPPIIHQKPDPPTQQTRKAPVNNNNMNNDNNKPSHSPNINNNMNNYYTSNTNENTNYKPQYLNFVHESYYDEIMDNIKLFDYLLKYQQFPATSDIPYDYRGQKVTEDFLESIKFRRSRYDYRQDSPPRIPPPHRSRSPPPRSPSRSPPRHDNRKPFLGGGGRGGYLNSKSRVKKIDDGLMICKFFNSARGCKKGSACPYTHRLVK